MKWILLNRLLRIPGQGVNEYVSIDEYYALLFTLPERASFSNCAVSASLK